MCKPLVRFGENLVSLSYDLDLCLAHWDALRVKMTRGVPSEFTRDEWAYLVSFLSREHLHGVFTESFGVQRNGEPTALFRARGKIAIWLPNNVSLLGPLVLLLSSLVGAPIWVKAGSKSNDLCTALVRYAATNLPEGELRNYLHEQVRIECFDRTDPRNTSMAAEASVRIVFGSDEAVTAIHSLPHPMDSIGISFANHRSEAWVQQDALDEAAEATLIKVFSLYGRAGCTSPQRIVLLEGTFTDCAALRSRLLALWTKTTKADVSMHVASSNILHGQLNAANGWDVLTASRNAAVLGIGSIVQSEMSGPMSLAIVSGTVQEAISTLPRNIQTLGHCVKEPSLLLPLLATSCVKRFVPVAKMHHFGPVWDGVNFWRQLFEQMGVQS